MSKRLMYLVSFVLVSNVVIPSECSGFASAITELVGLNTDYDLGGSL